MGARPLPTDLPSSPLPYTLSITKAQEAQPPKKQKRAPRTRKILSQAPGLEASEQGVERTEEEHARQPGMFSASNYFWLYYAAAGMPGLTKQVEVGQLAEVQSALIYPHLHQTPP